MNTTKIYRPFQLEDINTYKAVGNCVCGHKPGVGKTAVAIGLITGRTLIIVPRRALYQFADEIKAFRPELSATVISGTPAKRKKAYLTAPEVMLMTYESLRIDIGIIAALPEFQTIIFDEAHRLASPSTKLHKKIRALVNHYKVKPRIYAFTASLLMNSPMDIYGVYNIIQPSLFPNWKRFTDEYMNRHPSFGYITGARQDKLAQLGRIISPYYFSRTLEEVCPQMPPHHNETIRFDLSPAETKLYNDIRAELLFDIDPKSIDKVKSPMSLQNALTKLQKLSELTVHPGLIGSSGIPSTKLEILKEKLDEVLAGNDRKCIVYSWFERRLLEYVLPLTQDYNPVYIVGGMTDTESEAARVRFKTDPTCQVLFLSKAGSEALSFEEASYLIRLDTPFSIGRDVQLSGRIRRQTTVEPTFEYTLVAAGTVDERMLKILEKKKLMQSSIFDWDDVKDLLDVV